MILLFIYTTIFVYVFVLNRFDFFSEIPLIFLDKYWKILIIHIIKLALTYNDNDKDFDKYYDTILNNQKQKFKNK